ncbi:MAG: SusD/RagB family nutrient-binding outer membrane lipoprotein [Bacteroidales bacterium]|nr:SusD/RagB family nutrient-binding outer membrane lipoprotein [Bacteroidales bacterium]
MKNILKFNILLIFAVALIFSGCKWIDTDLNIDPDSPDDVPMELLLPSIQASSGYVIGGNTAVRTSNIWMQFFDGVDRQSLTEGRYQLNSADVNDLWENLYAQSMMDCKDLIVKAGEQNSPYYAGMAKVMLALNLGTLTNFFGDMPYTEAFDGANAVLQPVFDSQTSIYATIDDLLDEAIADLGQADNAVDIAGDLIYDGNTAMWIKAANALRARYAFYNGGNVTSYLADAFAAGENFSLAFSEGSNENPIFQFMRDRTDIRMSSTFVNMLADNNDPRLPFYAAPDGDGLYTGSDPGSENSAASYLGTYNASEDSPVIFSSYSEMKFIEAETLLSSDNATALLAWQDGVKGSVEAVVGDTSITNSWLNANINNVTTLTLQLIIEEKYKALYSTVIPYDDYRRTGFPVMQTVQGAIANAVPVRYPYPQSEITYNENCPSGVTTATGLWIFQ